MPVKLVFFVCLWRLHIGLDFHYISDIEPCEITTLYISPVGTKFFKWRGHLLKWKILSFKWKVNIWEWRNLLLISYCLIILSGNSYSFILFLGRWKCDITANVNFEKLPDGFWYLNWYQVFFLLKFSLSTFKIMFINRYLKLNINNSLVILLKLL